MSTKQFLLKLDLSGIQSFIFDVPSQGASKELKSRSFYVYALTHIAESYLRENFPENFDLIYNGGGNLFAFLHAEEEHLMVKILEFQSFFENESLFPFIGYVKAGESSFKETMNAIGKKMAISKLQKPCSFRPFDVARSHEWKEFTEKLVGAKSCKIQKGRTDYINGFNSDSITKAGFTLQLIFDEKETQNEEHTFNKSMLNKLPLGENNKTIVDFDTIAQKARAERGADDKLAALKMDVDNLGYLFRNKERNEYDTISKGIEKFFSETIYENMLKTEIESGNVYPVFAGGDDCFLIGGWDKIFGLVGQIQDAFYQFQERLREQFSIINEVTISAGVVVCNPNFPMVRLAEEAEYALELAKNEGKNRIAVFGEVLTWKEFNSVEKIAEELKFLVTEKGESRTLLERVKSSDIGFRSLQERAINRNQIDFPKVYRLKYYLRNVKKEDNRKKIEAMFKEYEADLLNDFLGKTSQTNPAKFPVAARWAELLTKQNENILN
jgi:CRISPR-associated protein Csm1